MNRKEEFVSFLIDSGALMFGDFTLKSGRKSPYMVDTGKFKTGALLAQLGKFYAHAIFEKMEEEIIPKNTNILFGSAYKGIPLAASASMALAEIYGLDIGYAFNRKEEKDHGEGGVFVGKKPESGDRILVVDDVMTAGTALRDTIALLRTHADGAMVVGSVIAVDRKERGYNTERSAVAEAQQEFGIPVFAIIDIDEIVYALGRAMPEQSASIEAYLKQARAADPGTSV